MKQFLFIVLIISAAFSNASVNAQKFRAGTKFSPGEIRRPAPKVEERTPVRTNPRTVEIKKPVVAPKYSSTNATAERMAANIKNQGRTGRIPRLKELANDPKLGSADRGWLRQEINAKAKGKRSTIRLPPDRELAHKRGFEAAKGFSHEHSVLQAKELHRFQHRHDNNGRKQITPSKTSKK